VSSGVGLFGLASAGVGLMVPAASVALGVAALVVLLALGGRGLLALTRDLRRTVVSG